MPDLPMPKVHRVDGVSDCRERHVAHLLPDVHSRRKRNHRGDRELTVNVLTEAEFTAELDRYLAEWRERCITAWKRGSEEHGPCQLDSSDWIAERMKEEADWINYTVMDRTRLRRMAQKATKIGYRVP